LTGLKSPACILAAYPSRQEFQEADRAHAQDFAQD
jgi:hypothetical protein